MNKHEYVLDLIGRMSDTSLIEDIELGGSRPLSQLAYEEARTLTDINLVPILKNIIQQHSSNKVIEKNIRSKSYFILFKLAMNTRTPEVFFYFEERLSTETDKYLIGDSLLHYLLESEYLPSLDSIKPFIHHKDWQIRHVALRLLGRYEKELVEDILIASLHENLDRFEIDIILGALRSIQSTKILYQLEPYLHHKIGDVRASAVATIRHLGGAKFMPNFVKALSDRAPAVKLNALYAILQYGNEEQIPVLISRLKTILSRNRQTEPGNLDSSEVFLIVNFLLAHETEKLNELIQWIYQKKWNMLFEIEQNWLEKVVQIQK
nr:HEAT repeat domain-containing protein [Lysinibacillus timonensis]